MEPPYSWSLRTLMEQDNETLWRCSRECRWISHVRLHGWSRYVKPTVPVTPNFAEAQAWKEEDGWKVAQPGDDLIRGKWWELYGDATLNEIEDQVDSSNQDLKIAEANLRQAAQRFASIAPRKRRPLEVLPAFPIFELPLTNRIFRPAQSTMAAEISFFL